jgi:hypothetical protein
VVDPSVLAGAQTVALAATPGLGPYQAVSYLWGGSDVNIWAIEGTPPHTRERSAAGVSTLVLAGAGGGGAPLAQAAVLRVGATPTPDLDFWTVVDPNVVRPFAEEELLWVRDKTGVPRPLDNDLEARLYNDMLLRAYQTTDEAFRKAAEGDLDRTDALLHPKHCRGKVFRVEGQLQLLRRYNAPPALRESWGMRDVYEGWIRNPSKYGDMRVCVLLAALPQGLQPGEDLDVPVEFVGTYYKLLRYATDDKAHPYAECPLLMGHSLTADQESAGPDAEQHWAKDLAPIFLWSLVGVVGVVIGFSVWFRFSDQAVRRRLAARRAHVQLPEPAPDEAEADSASPPQPS